MKSYSPLHAVVLILAITFTQLHISEGKCKRSDQIECKTGEECVYRKSVCDNTKDCNDGSDEDINICKSWSQKDQQGCYETYDGDYNYEDYNDRCLSAYEMCQDHTTTVDSKLCKILEQEKLGILEDRMIMSSAVVTLLTSAVHSTLNYKTPDCPMLYTRVGKDCLAFFSPAKISWAEARQFCISIYGDLWHSEDIISYLILIQYLKKQGLSSNYWIGGRFNMDTNSWSWVIDNSAMPLGVPYWAIKHNDSCVLPNKGYNSCYSPHEATAYFAHCHRPLVSPVAKSQGWCSAMTSEYYYYWSDERCDEAFSPLCVFTGPAAHKDSDQ